jgi:polyphosphate kinase 2 (PPK2 family)
MSDIAERKLWGKCVAAYESMIQATSRPQGPGTWFQPTTNHLRVLWWWRR